MALPNTNIVTSKFAVKERWLKLYRTVYNKFLKIDFAHKQDYLQDLTQLNARITELETKITTELTKLQVGLIAHAHTTTAPGNPTSPPLGPPYTSGFSPTKPVVHKETFLEQRDAALQATGPAQAPLGDGSSPEAQQANIQIKQNIGPT